MSLSVRYNGSFYMYDSRELFCHVAFYVKNKHGGDVAHLGVGPRVDIKSVFRPHVKILAPVRKQLSRHNLHYGVVLRIIISKLRINIGFVIGNFKNLTRRRRCMSVITAGIIVILALINLNRRIQ